MQGEPELQLTTEGETLRMQIHPPFEQDQKIYLIKESPTRLKVFQAKEEYKKIAAIVGNGLKLPAQAKEKALQAINSLSSILTVHSDIGSGSAELVPGDATPCFHLLPYNAGVKLELLVRPFSDAGPYFRPARGRNGNGGDRRETGAGETGPAAGGAARGRCGRGRSRFWREGEESDGEWLVPSPDPRWSCPATPGAGRHRSGGLAGGGEVQGPAGGDLRQLQGIHQADEGLVRTGGGGKDERGLAIDLQQLMQLAKEGTGRFVPLGEGEFLALSAELASVWTTWPPLPSRTARGFASTRWRPGVFEEFAGGGGRILGGQAVAGRS